MSLKRRRLYFAPANPAQTSQKRALATADLCADGIVWRRVLRPGRQRGSLLIPSRARRRPSTVTPSACPFVSISLPFSALRSCPPRRNSPVTSPLGSYFVAARHTGPAACSEGGACPFTFGLACPLENRTDFPGDPVALTEKVALELLCPRSVGTAAGIPNAICKAICGGFARIIRLKFIRDPSTCSVHRNI